MARDRGSVPDTRRTNHGVIHQLLRQRRWVAFGAVLLSMLLWVAAAALAPSVSGIEQLALTDDIGMFCLLAISALLSPLHHLFEFAVFSGLAWATWDRFRAWREARTLLRQVSLSPVTEGSLLHEASVAAGLSPSKLVRISGTPLPAFTIGALTPRVFVSDRLESVLTRDELIAVLSHEGEHVRRRDPLRLSVMRFITRTLYWLPALRALESQLLEETELRADAAASRRSGVATASALLALVKHFGRRRMPAMSTGFSPHEFLTLRVKLITGDDSHASSTVTRSDLLVTLGTLALMWTAAIAELQQSTHTQHLVRSASECEDHQPHPLGRFMCLEESESATQVVPGSGTGR